MVYSSVPRGNKSDCLLKKPVFCLASGLRPELGPQCKAAITFAERFGSMPILDGNSVILISDTNEVIHQLIADIEKAKEHVHMLSCIPRTSCDYNSLLCSRRAFSAGDAGGRPKGC